MALFPKKYEGKSRQKAFLNQLKPSRDTYSPKIQFALNADMITDEEVCQLRKGNMEIQGGNLFLSNARSSCGKKPGEYVKLYQGRRLDLMARKLLGMGDG